MQLVQEKTGLVIRDGVEGLEVGVGSTSNDFESVTEVSSPPLLCYSLETAFQEIVSECVRPLRAWETLSC